MKIAYFLVGDYSKENGVVKKILNQINCWSMAGNDVKIFHLSTNEYSIFYDKQVKSEVVGCKNILFHSASIYNSIKKYKPDIIYTRYILFNNNLYKMMKNYKVIAEFNSDDIAEFKIAKDRTIKLKFKYYYNLFTRKLFLYLLSGAVFVSFELEKKIPLKKPTIVIENGCDIQESHEKLTQSDIPQLLFIGTPEQTWHGIDKLIELAKRTKGKLNFHIIGMEKSSVAEEIENIKFYGWLDKDKYQKIFDICDIGIGTIALHRKTMEESSSLKTREYLTNGMPIILGGIDTTIEKHKLKLDYVLNIGNTEKNVLNSEKQILNFSMKMMNKRIKDVNLEYFSWEYLEKERLKYFKMILEKR